MKEKILTRGAEAIISLQQGKVHKKRTKKSYRLKEIDDKLRKLRTRKEARLLEKLKDKIPVPALIKVDEKNKEIIIEYIKGKKLSEHLDKLKDKEKIMKTIGEQVAILHNLNIIHSDLTTSNMVLSNKKIYFIDFGLSFHSTRIEDKAVDLHLLKQALEAKHFQHWKKLFGAVLKGYKSKDKTLVLRQLKKVELRGRYKK